MPIIEIDKSVLEEIEDVIEQRDKIYENHIATTKKLTDSIEKVYEQEVKKLQNQLQQKENIIKEVREYIEKNWISQKDADNYRFDDEELDIEISDIAVLFDILDKEVN